MGKCNLSVKGNPNSIAIYVVVFSPPLAQAKCMISIEPNTVHTSSEPPMTISSKQVVVDVYMMMDLLGVDYTVYEIRECTTFW
jgi:hypothetical protein